MINQITIMPVDNGFVVIAGCAKLVYEGRETILTDFRDWLENPARAERRIKAGRVMFSEVEKYGAVPAMPPTAMEQSVGGFVANVPPPSIQEILGVS